MHITPRLRSIVVGVDGSPSSSQALDWAIDEAQRRDRPLHLVHAYGLDRPFPAGPLEQALERVRNLAPGLRVTTESSSGHAGPVLVEISRGADTIVLGARGRGAVTGVLLGSVSVEVAAHASCPVVVVRDVGSPGPSRPRVVVGVDGSEASALAVGYAFAQADARGLGLTVVHSWWMDFVEGVVVTTSSSAQWEALGREHHLLVSEALAGWPQKYPEVDVREHIMRMRPVDALVRESEGAELVVVGSRGHGGVAGLLLGSVSQGVLHRAHSPVAVVGPESVAG